MSGWDTSQRKVGGWHNSWVYSLPLTLTHAMLLHWLIIKPTCSYRVTNRRWMSKSLGCPGEKVFHCSGWAAITTRPSRHTSIDWGTLLSMCLWCRGAPDMGDHVTTTCPAIALGRLDHNSTLVCDLWVCPRDSVNFLQGVCLILWPALGITFPTCIFQWVSGLLDCDPAMAPSPQEELWLCNNNKKKHFDHLCIHCITETDTC